MQSSDPENPDGSTFIVIVALILSAWMIIFSFLLMTKMENKGAYGYRKNDVCRVTFGDPDSHACRMHATKH